MNRIINKNKSKITVPGSIKQLLWEYKINNNIKGFDSIIIIRIMGYGNLKDIKWMFENYSFNKIVQCFSNLGYKNLSRGNFDFWFGILKFIKKNNINWTEIREKRLSHQKLNKFWNY